MSCCLKVSFSETSREWVPSLDKYGWLNFTLPTPPLALIQLMFFFLG